MLDILGEISEKAIEKLFMKLLEDFSSNDLEYAVENNVSLLLLTQEYRPKMLMLASGIARNFRGQGHLLNIDNVIKWLEANRKDFSIKIITDNNKKEWLKRQVDDFRNFLFSG